METNPPRGTLTHRIVNSIQRRLLGRERVSGPGPEGALLDEGAFVASARGAQVVAVHNPTYQGITSATRQLFAHTYPFPAPPALHPTQFTDGQVAHHAELLLSTGVEHFVISGGDLIHHRLVTLLKQRAPRVRVDLLWHGSYVQFWEDYDWKMFQLWVKAAREGVIHKLGVVKKGMEEFLERQGIRSAFVANFVPGVPQSPPAIEGPELQVGIWVSRMNYRKLPFAMLAALKMIPGARLHATGLGPRGREVIETFGIPVESLPDRPLSPEELTAAMRRTHLSLYVTFSECTPMLPLESLHAGVPCLLGPVSHLFEDHPFLFERLVVPFPDRAEVIARQMLRVRDEREAILTEYNGYAKRYNEEAEQLLAAFLEGARHG